MTIVEVRNDYEVILKLEIDDSIIPCESMVVMARFMGELADIAARERKNFKRRTARAAKKSEGDK